MTRYRQSSHSGDATTPGAIYLMRRPATLVLLAGLTGCTGFGEFLDHTFTPPGTIPTLPMADSENVRRALGHPTEIEPLGPEPGNVWPARQGPEPTLAGIGRQQNTEASRGFPPTTVPGAIPGLPAGRQPRPQAGTRGSSTPPGIKSPGLDRLPQIGVQPPPFSSAPGPGPNQTGGIVNTPNGPAVDAGGTKGYRQLTTPRGPGAIMVPNGNGTSTIISPDGSVQTVPTPR